MRFDQRVYSDIQLSHIKSILIDNQDYFDKDDFSKFGEWITYKANTASISGAIFDILIDTEIAPFNKIKDIPVTFLINICATLSGGNNNGVFTQQFSTFEVLPPEYIEFLKEIGVKVYKYKKSNLYMFPKPGENSNDIMELMETNPYFKDKSNINDWEEL